LEKLTGRPLGRSRYRWEDNIRMEINSLCGKGGYEDRQCGPYIAITSIAYRFSINPDENKCVRDT
jgi:hypothetical protein